MNMIPPGPNKYLIIFNYTLRFGITTCGRYQYHKVSITGSHQLGFRNRRAIVILCIKKGLWLLEITLSGYHTISSSSSFNIANLSPLRYVCGSGYWNHVRYNIIEFQEAHKIPLLMVRHINIDRLELSHKHRTGSSWYQPLSPTSNPNNQKHSYINQQRTRTGHKLSNTHRSLPTAQHCKLKISCEAKQTHATARRIIKNRSYSFYKKLILWNEKIC